MGKPKEEEGPPAPAAWISTFSDLMNLLLCFFVLLFSMSTIDAEKLEQVVASFNNTFSIFNGGAAAIGDGMLVSNGVSQLNELSKYVNSTGVADDDADVTDNIYTDATTQNPNENVGSPDTQTGAEQIDISDLSQDQIIAEMEEMKIAESESMAEQIEEMLTENNIEDIIDVDFTSQYVLLTFKGAFLFDPGKATLRKESLDTMGIVAEILESYSGSLFEIEGHTDNVPMGSKKLYKDNDELSAARALAVFRYLVDHSLLDPASIKHSGRGEYVPVADNSTEAGRAKNRRVEIKIYNSLSSY